MGHRQKSKNRREIPIDIIPNILLRLPCKDFVRSSCVCKPWRSIVADPSFRNLHVAHHAAAASSEPEVLLVTETGKPGWSDDASFFNLSSGAALSHVPIPRGYRLAGVCNDLLCFVFDYDQDQAPVIVCNPVTGETLQLPKAPPLPTGDELSHLFVLGFSASTKKYKMFRLSFPGWHGSRDKINYIAVYSLGGGDCWRQSSYLSQFHPVELPVPVHIDGNIFIPTADLADKRARAARMLVLDVATETPRSYRIPYNFDDYHEGWHRMASGGFDDLLVDGFDLNGQMCLVVPVGSCSRSSRERIQFWVMELPGEIKSKDDDDHDDKLYWDLRYSFYFNDNRIGVPRGAWIDQAQTLCCRFGNSVLKYDTRGYSSSSNGVVNSVLFDKRLDLPDGPPRPRGSLLSSHWLEYCQWSICGS